MHNKEMKSLELQLKAALRELDHFDQIDKGSKWITHSEEGKRLGDRVRELDSLIENTEIIDRCHKYKRRRN